MNAWLWGVWGTEDEPVFHLRASVKGDVTNSTKGLGCGGDWCNTVPESSHMSKLEFGNLPSCTFI